MTDDLKQKKLEESYARYKDEMTKLEQQQLKLLEEIVEDLRVQEIKMVEDKIKKI